MPVPAAMTRQYLLGALPHSHCPLPSSVIESPNGTQLTCAQRSEPSSRKVRIVCTRNTQAPPAACTVSPACMVSSVGLSPMQEPLIQTVTAPVPVVGTYARLPSATDSRCAVLPASSGTVTMLPSSAEQVFHALYAGCGRAGINIVWRDISTPQTVQYVTSS